MLTQIKLTNFKCFKEETTFPLSRFNLFTGVNGGGKSTALQSLLLMRQSIEHSFFTSELILNGSCVNLGSFDDVRNSEVSRDNPILFEFVIKATNNIFDGSMCYKLMPQGDNLSLSILEVSRINFINNHVVKALLNDGGSYKFEGFQQIDLLRGLEISPFQSNSGEMYISSLYNYDKIHFISADRIGPKEVYSKSPLSKFSHIDANGEFTVNLLDKLAEQLVDDSLCLGEDAKTLRTQTEAWLGKILNPLTLKIKPLDVNYLQLLIGDYKPSNVGFGYSIILPIIVTGLIAQPNEKIIIENPEIHLHPKAQSALIDFLVRVSNTGVQIFIESHSDHVLNALRVAAKESRLLSEDISVLFFKRNEVNNAEIVSIVIDEKGKLHRKTHEGMTSKIPKGFFDEWTNSMAKLF